MVMPVSLLWRDPGERPGGLESEVVPRNGHEVIAVRAFHQAVALLLDRLKPATPWKRSGSTQAGP